MFVLRDEAVFPTSNSSRAELVSDETLLNIGHGRNLEWGSSLGRGEFEKQSTFQQTANTCALAANIFILSFFQLVILTENENPVRLEMGYLA